MPPNMIKTTVVSIVKNKCGNLSESSNYRPIALATITSKVFKSVLLLKCEDYLFTSSNQFGYKKGHSTDLCISMHWNNWLNITRREAHLYLWQCLMQINHLIE